MRKGQEFELAYEWLYKMDESKYLIESPAYVIDKISESRRKGYSSRDIVKDFESLKNGDKTIEDLFMYFSDEDYKCLLGIEGFLL